MKKTVAILLSLVMLVCVFASCGDSDEHQHFETRTAAFYGGMAKDSFWFKMSFTNNGETYVFTQATNGKNVTTIEDHDGTERDTYQLLEGNRLHILNVSRKTYDTIVNGKGQNFLFADYNASMFNNPKKTDNEEFEGKTYYCETFSTSSYTDGAISGENKYYFDGNKLVAIEIIDGGDLIMVMRFKEYSNTIPKDVYVEIPKDFEGETLQVENEIDYNEYWGDLTP